MNYLAEMSRDCSKNRPSTFTELAFPIVQDIENKIKNKNQMLRRKYKQRLADKAKAHPAPNPEHPNPRPIPNKLHTEHVNYLECYEPHKPPRDPNALQIGIEKLDEKDEEMAFHIYLLMRKRKTIFKVEEVRRKLKTHPKRTRLYDPEARNRQKYALERRSDKRRQKVESSEAGDLLEEEVYKKEEDEQRDVFIRDPPMKDVPMKEPEKDEEVKEEAVQEPFVKQMEAEGALRVAEELIAHPPAMQPVEVLRITRKEEEMVIPKIDVIEEEPHKPEADQEPVVVERDRISEVESKSEVSESRRNRSSQVARESGELGDCLLEKEE